MWRHINWPARWVRHQSHKFRADATIESEGEMDVDDAGADESRVNVDADADSELEVIPDSQESDTD